MWQHVFVRVKSAEVAVSAESLLPSPRGCPAAFGAVPPRASVELGLARAALLFLAVCAPPMGSHRLPPGLLPDWTGAEALKMTFVDDLLHQDVWRDFHSWQSLGVVVTEKQANEKN